MKKLFKKLFWRTEDEGDMHIHPNSEASFNVIYNDLLIGTLSLKDEEWNFDYSSKFKDQKSIRPIVDFPDKSKNYSSDELWPFFASRIPGTGQPMVQNFLLKNNVKETDAVVLLKEFGKKSITNPYELVPA